MSVLKTTISDEKDDVNKADGLYYSQKELDERKLREQLSALREYVSELSEQNELLVETIEQLENESNTKIFDLTKRCEISSVLVQEQDQVVEGLKKHNKCLKSDVENLVFAVTQFQTTGECDFSQILLETIPAETFQTSSNDENVAEHQERSNSSLMEECETLLQDDAHSKNTESSSDPSAIEEEDDFHSHLNQLNEDVTKYQENLDNYADQIALCELQIDDLRAENQVLADTVELREIELQNKSNNILLLENDIEDLNNRISSSSDSKQRELQLANEKIVSLTTTLSELKVTGDDERVALANEVAKQYDISSQAKKELFESKQNLDGVVKQVKLQAEVILNLRKDLKLKSCEEKPVPEIILNQCTQEDVKALERNVEQLEQQVAEGEAKIVLRDRTVERLKGLQTEYLEKVSKLEEAGRKMELNSIQKDEEHCKNREELDKLRRKFSNTLNDFQSLQESHGIVLKERKELQAKIEIWKENLPATMNDEFAPYDGDILSELRNENANYKQQYEENIQLKKAYEKQVEELEMFNAELTEKLRMKEKVLLDFDALVADFRLKDVQNRCKFDEYEDEAREIVLRLHSVEREKDQELHKLAISEEHVTELSEEVGQLTTCVVKLEDDIKTKQLTIDRLNADISNFKMSCNEKEAEVNKQDLTIRSLEKRLSQANNNFFGLENMTQADVSIKDQRILMLEEELETANQRYADVNSELTNVEAELELEMCKFKDVLDDANLLNQQLHAAHEDIHQLEVDLTIITEKHQTCVDENLQKDNAILNFQSKLVSAEQESEHNVEEYTRKTKEIDQLKSEVNQLTEHCQLLRKEKNHSCNQAKSFQEELSLAKNENKNIEAEREELSTLNNRLAEELTILRDTHTKTVRELEALNDLAADLQDEINALKEEVSSSNETAQNALQEKNIAINERAETSAQLDETRQRHDDFKDKKDKELTALNEQISSLEEQTHMFSMKVLKLESSLNLSEEKLKHSENKLFECDRVKSTLEERIEEKDVTVREQEKELRNRADDLESLFMIKEDQSAKLNKQSEHIIVLEKEMLLKKKSLEETQSRSDRCEEMIRGVRAKLKVQSTEIAHQKELHSQLQNEHKTLQSECEHVRNELMGAETRNNVAAGKLSDASTANEEMKSQMTMLQSEYVGISEDYKRVMEDRNRANEKINYFEKMVCDLQQSLGKDNQDLQADREVLTKKLQSVSEKLADTEQNNDIILGDVNSLRESVSKYSEEVMVKQRLLDEKDGQLSLKCEEMFAYELTIQDLQEQMKLVLEDNQQLNLQNNGQENERHELYSQVSDLHQQHKTSLQQMAHYEEKVNLVERNLSSTQEQLNSRLTEVVKLEKLVRKYQHDLRKALEEQKSKENQISKFMEDVKGKNTEIEELKKKEKELIEQNCCHESALQSFENQLNEAHYQTEQLSLELEKQNNACVTSAQTTNEFKEKLSKKDQIITQQKNDFTELKEKFRVLTEEYDTSSRKLESMERCNVQLHTEVETYMKKTKISLEETASKDAELRVLRTEMEGLEKKCEQYECQIRHNNEIQDELKRENKGLKESSSRNKTSYVEKEQEYDHLRHQLSSVKGSLQESVEQLTERSRQLTALRDELHKVKQKSNNSDQQLALQETKSKRLKIELKRCLEKTKRSSQELVDLNNQVIELKTEMHQASEQHRKANSLLTNRDEQILSLKVDVTSFEEKLKLRDEQIGTKNNECIKLQQLYDVTLQKFQEAQHELDTVRSNGDRLTQESEMVVQNMTSWVKEQRHGNEKIAAKLNKQEALMAALEKSNRELVEKNKSLKRNNELLSKNIDALRSEGTKYIKQKNLTMSQDNVIAQLKETIQELQEDMVAERAERSRVVEDLQTKAKTHVETIQQLHKQLSELSKDNIRQRTLLERQAVSRKNLHAQLKTQEIDLNTLRENFNRSFDEQEPARIASKVSSLLNSELEKANEVHDKQYWVDRVGQLSNQLEESTDYWARKRTSIPNLP